MSQLFDQPVIVVAQQPRAFSSRAEYEVHAEDGELLARLDDTSSGAARFFGRLGGSSYSLTRPDGAEILTIERPGGLGKSTFNIHHADGTSAGSVRQESSFSALKFTLFTPNAATTTLAGGGFGNRHDWTLSDESDTERGWVTNELQGLKALFSNADTFVIRLDHQLTGPMRTLAVAATICLDVIRDERKRGAAANQANM